jgi:integrase
VLKDKEPTFEPDQFDLLINAAHRDPREQDLVPALAIAAFGRMRMSEISRLDFSAVHLEKGEIDVSSRVAGKTGNARIIEMPENLAQWLKPYIRASGPTLDPKIGRIDNRVRRFAQKIGLKWKRNILRGSCASYLYALTNDLKYVAAQLGTSERTLRREYLERKTRAEAERWFAIAPDKEGNILDLRWATRE